MSLTENLDAMEAVQHIPLDDREAFKYALAATLVKNHAHWRAFETVFEVYFSLRGAEFSIDDESATPARRRRGWTTWCRRRATDRASPRAARARALTPEELAEMLYKALLRGDQAMTSRGGPSGRSALRRHGAGPSGRRHLLPVPDACGTWTSRACSERLMQQAHEDSPEPLTSLEERLEHDEYENRIDQLKKEIEAEIRRRLVADRGVEAMAKTLRKPLPEDIDFMHASREEMVTLRKALQPLTRRLAVRLARKRRHGRKGALDFRNTVRHSLSYGGVPAEPKFRYPRPSKPEIIVIADISGSVAAFARFTLHLVHAIAGQFSRVRSFVFIDGIDEVTRFFEGTEDIVEAIHRVNTEADVVWVDGHSDYGHAFEVFWQRYGKDIGPKTTVIILGDARNNYHASQSWVIKEMRHKARHVYWLNPEPRAVLGHRRLDRGGVRGALRRGVRVPQPPPARAVRRSPGLIGRICPTHRSGGITPEAGPAHLNRAPVGASRPRSRGHHGGRVLRGWCRCSGANRTASTARTPR